jgi:hypothetical protein
MCACLISGGYVLIDIAKSRLEACIGTSEKEEPCPQEGVIKAEEFNLPRLHLEFLRRINGVTAKWRPNAFASG